MESLTSNIKLYVISVISNPARFDRRYTLFKEFCDRVKHEKAVSLVTVELQQGHRPYVTDATIKLRTDDELWFKENLINIAVNHLPKDWEYFAWVDSDIEFQNKNWVRDTIEQLKTYKIVQLFSHAIDMGIKYETLQVNIGFAYKYVNGENFSDPRSHPKKFNTEFKYPQFGKKNGSTNSQVFNRFYDACDEEPEPEEEIVTRRAVNGNQWHSGYAWAMRRKTYDDLGGLLDFAILGSSDHHMAFAFIGKISSSTPKDVSKNYKKLLSIYADRCEKYVKRDIGFVHGTILHHFHGNKVNRQYNSRWKIIKDFDPITDIKKDSSNLWKLDEYKIKLRDQIRMYFRLRNEDENTMTQEYEYVKKEWI